jgi:GT2 family glycosyltransferase
VSAGEPERRPGEIGVVVATSDRRSSLLRTLDRLAALPERPPVVVVDNASSDGSAEAVTASHPQFELLRLPRNHGAFARNLGVARLRTPFAAFSDDDSWWEPGSLGAASALFRRHPGLGLIAARVLVGPERRLDPVSALMREGPAAPGLPGPRIDGFLACGVAVRRTAFLEAGGFCERFLIGGEEELLAIDMRAAGWELCYADELTAVHLPHGGSRGERSWLSRRNALWTSWLRRPAGQALWDTAGTAAAAVRDPIACRALLSALRGLPWALASRRHAAGASPRRSGGL